ncbi:MAG: TetR/AcrR family transcriptional regulator [Frankia sp.]
MSGAVRTIGVVAPAPSDGETAKRGARWWGSETALLDDDEARRRLVAATARCIVRRGSARLPIDDIAAEAGVSRSTVYRYFKTRDDLILGVLLSRIDLAMEHLVHSLPHPDDAALAIPDLILNSVDLIGGDEVNVALYSEDSRSLVTALEMTSEPIVDGIHRYVGPLLEGWQADGQLRSDLDIRETVRWLNTVALLLLAPPWSGRSRDAMRTFLERYLVRALVVS